MHAKNTPKKVAMQHRFGYTYGNNVIRTVKMLYVPAMSKVVTRTTVIKVYT